MEVLFDLQQEIDTLDLNSSNLLVTVGNQRPTLAISVVDDIKTILIKDRQDRISGLGIDLKELPNLRAGDRITVTGRIPRESAPGSWGVALIIEESETRRAEECQLAQQASPKILFALSHLLGSADLNSLVMVQTTRWGAVNPVMDIYVDSILILRDSNNASIEEDPRTLVYSLDTDKNLRLGRYAENSFGTGILTQSGTPVVTISESDGEKNIFLSERGKEWDGVDVNLASLNLLTGNMYQIVAKGQLTGDAPKDARITLMGVPGYSWRGSTSMKNKKEFKLVHTLSYAEVEKWKTVRITTNAWGASVPFYITDIEVKRLGLL
ncbi:MAG: hypothetical protein FWF80_08695 [Defluviitaleaceae bacterium]|nr:hypothetical protein [Defluviitaleaceae bacterium]